MQLTVNGTTREVDVDPETPLLWAIREELGLTGTKYGCGIGVCARAEPGRNRLLAVGRPFHA